MCKNVFSGQTGNEWHILAEPVGRMLHFAGEHTHTEYMSTVHGAYLSGIRAANDITGRNSLGPEGKDSSCVIL